VVKGHNAFETGDGAWLYVLDDGKIYRMLPDGTQAVAVREGGVGVNNWNVGGRSVFVYEPGTRWLWKSPFGTDKFEKAYQFGEKDGPEGGGVCFAVPNDESYVILRRETRLTATLMLGEGFR
jgi:hypothetical protein